MSSIEQRQQEALAIGHVLAHRQFQIDNLGEAPEDDDEMKFGEWFGRLGRSVEWARSAGANGDTEQFRRSMIALGADAVAAIASIDRKKA